MSPLKSRLLSSPLLSGPDVRIKKEEQPELLLQNELIALGSRTPDGHIVTAVQLPWWTIVQKIKNDPSFLGYFSKNPRALEEFLAGLYRQAGFEEVVLTPRSSDGGRDVIAVKRGFCSVRILGQAKAYKAGHLVGHDDCRALIGVLTAEPNSSKGMIVTTSDFAPGIKTAPTIQQFVPNRLELVNGLALPKWLSGLNQPPEL
jgi:restriction system protein